MSSLMQTLRGFGTAKLGLMVVVSVALIGAFSLIAMRIVSPALAPLYNELSPDDSAKITTELGKLGVPYEALNNGAQIMVPAERVLRLRMSMAEIGLPSNGSVVGYEIFDRSETFGSSNFVMNVNMMRALEGELARTINSFKQVESARVHLVVPKRELFSKDKQEPSASVALKLRGGQELNKDEIAAITHFVAAAVPNLLASRVTVVDSYGRLLARGDGQNTVGAVAAITEEYRVSFENRTRDTLESLVEKIVGPGSVKVQVAADVNFDRITTDSEKFDPEGQVARSVQSTSSKDDSSEGAGKDAATVANQLPTAGAGAAGSQSSKASGEKSDETTNYEISKTVERHVKEGGTIKRISVAVLLDGVYAEDGKYTPRPEEELKRIESLVKSAVVFDEKRGDKVEVVNMQFSKTTEQASEESFFANFKHEMEAILQTLIIAGVAILAIMMLLRPLIQHMMKLSAASAERVAIAQENMNMGGVGGQQQVIMRLPGAGGAPGAVMPGAVGGPTVVEEEDDSFIDLQNIKGRVKSSSLRKVVDFVDKNPNEAMSVMRQWMVKESSL